MDTPAAPAQAGTDAQDAPHAASAASDPALVQSICDAVIELHSPYETVSVSRHVRLNEILDALEPGEAWAALLAVVDVGEPYATLLLSVLELKVVYPQYRPGLPEANARLREMLQTRLMDASRCWSTRMAILHFAVVLERSSFLQTKATAAFFIDRLHASSDDPVTQYLVLSLLHSVLATVDVPPLPGLGADEEGDEDAAREAFVNTLVHLAIPIALHSEHRAALAAADLLVELAAVFPHVCVLMLPASYDLYDGLCKRLLAELRAGADQFAFAWVIIMQRILDQNISYMSSDNFQERVVSPLEPLVKQASLLVDLINLPTLAGQLRRLCCEAFVSLFEAPPMIVVVPRPVLERFCLTLIDLATRCDAVPDRQAFETFTSNEEEDERNESLRWGDFAGNVLAELKDFVPRVEMLSPCLTSKLDAMLHMGVEQPWQTRFAAVTVLSYLTEAFFEHWADEQMDFLRRMLQAIVHLARGHVMPELRNEACQTLGQLLLDANDEFIDDEIMGQDVAHVLHKIVSEDPSLRVRATAVTVVQTLLEVVDPTSVPELANYFLPVLVPLLAQPSMLLVAVVTEALTSLVGPAWSSLAQHALVCLPGMVSLAKQHKDAPLNLLATALTFLLHTATSMGNPEMLVPVLGLLTAVSVSRLGWDLAAEPGLAQLAAAACLADSWQANESALRALADATPEPAARPAHLDQAPPAERVARLLPAVEPLVPALGDQVDALIFLPGDGSLVGALPGQAKKTALSREASASAVQDVRRAWAHALGSVARLGPQADGESVPVYRALPTLLRPVLRDLILDIIAPIQFTPTVGLGAQTDGPTMQGLEHRTSMLALLQSYVQSLDARMLLPYEGELMRALRPSLGIVIMPAVVHVAIFVASHLVSGIRDFYEAEMLRVVLAAAEPPSNAPPHDGFPVLGAADAAYIAELRSHVCLKLREIARAVMTAVQSLDEAADDLGKSGSDAYCLAETACTFVSQLVCLTVHNTITDPHDELDSSFYALERLDRLEYEDSPAVQEVLGGLCYPSALDMVSAGLLLDVAWNALCDYFQIRDDLVGEALADGAAVEGNAFGSHGQAAYSIWRTYLCLMPDHGDTLGHDFMHDHCDELLAGLLGLSREGEDDAPVVALHFEHDLLPRPVDELAVGLDFARKFLEAFPEEFMAECTWARAIVHLSVAWLQASDLVIRCAAIALATQALLVLPLDELDFAPRVISVLCASLNVTRTLGSMGAASLAALRQHIDVVKAPFTSDGDGGSESNEREDEAPGGRHQGGSRRAGRQSGGGGGGGGGRGGRGGSRGGGGGRGNDAAEEDGDDGRGGPGGGDDDDDDDEETSDTAAWRTEARDRTMCSLVRIVDRLASEQPQVDYLALATDVPSHDLIACALLAWPPKRNSPLAECAVSILASAVTQQRPHFVGPGQCNMVALRAALSASVLAMHEASQAADEAFRALELSGQ